MSKDPKIMFFDIETSPNEVYSWRVGNKINLTPDNIIKERRVMCICWKYKGEGYTYSLTWDEEQDDKSMLKEFGEELRDADVAIGHNGDNFDIKWVKTRTLYHNLPPINQVTTIDTLKLARVNFNFNSNKLDYLGKVLKVGAKTETGGYSLWTRVMDGEEEAMEEMVEYCRNDVVLLEDVYDKLVPHAAKLPVHIGSLLSGTRECCPACGETEFYAIHAKTLASGKKSLRRKCADCHHLYRIYK